MSRRSQVVVLAFDACDIDLVRDLAAHGKLPTFSRLLGEWASGSIDNPYGLFVGTLWSSFFTGRSAARTGWHCWETISWRNYERRLPTPREIVGTPFWRALSEAGRKIAVLDVPHCRVEGATAGIEIYEYGCHDRHFGLRSFPGPLAGEILSRIGIHPIFTVNPFAEREFAPDDYVHRAAALRTAAEEQALFSDMMAGLARKRELCKWLWTQSAWDLFIAVFGESHAIGHQCWHLHDAAHPRFDADLARTMGNPLEQTYRGLDRALADQLAVIGANKSIFVLLSHGMGPHYDGTHILEEVLTRLDSYYKYGRIAGGRPVRSLNAMWAQAPAMARRLSPALLARLPRRVNRRLFNACSDDDVGPAHRAQRKFFLSPNNFVYGGIRINLIGREPSGLVQPGAEFDLLFQQLRRDLLSMVNVATGEPMIRDLVRTDERYRREPVDELPDLIVEWNRSAPIETVWSPKTGLVHGRYTHWRTGDHKPGGALFVSHPGIAPGTSLGKIAISDLGPTICAMLGIQLENVDGRVVPDLVRGSLLEVYHRT